MEWTHSLSAVDHIVFEIVETSDATSEAPFPAVHPRTNGQLLGDVAREPERR